MKRNNSKGKPTDKRPAPGGDSKPADKRPALARESKTTDAKSREPKPAGGEVELEALLQYLERTRGFDFTAYKRSTLSRRIDKRMAEVGINNYTEYTDYLEVHPEEFRQLFNTILINVTDFFRDPPAWEMVRDDIIPRIINGKRPVDPIRVWSAGCASGEEAYTTAMLFADALGADAFRLRVKIYGTDADEEALNQARQASYTDQQVQAVPPELLKKHFDRVNGRFVFKKDLRLSVIFGRHDLIQDSPISRVDLIICRNTLMYFNAEAQARILSRFGFALNDTGFLFLGKAETLLTRLNMFSPVDLKRRLFSKIPRATPRDRLVIAAEGLMNGNTGATEDVRLREAALDADPVAQIIVDANGVLTFINESARALFNLTYNDAGRPVQALELSYRPVELRSLIQQAQLDRHLVVARDIEFSTAVSGPRFFDLSVIPLFDAAGATVGTKVIYSDITRFKRLQDELHQSHQELETAYEELQSANEELETTNEELQSTVEELETTNEELQSTNEELETMNEELQSTNEELETANEQLRERGEELYQLNGFNEAILNNMLQGLIVVDKDMRITAWNGQAEELWGLRADEVKGKHLLNLDIGLPVQSLRQPVRAVLAGEAEKAQFDLSAMNRRGKPIQLAVSITPLGRAGHSPVGALLITEERRNEAS